MEHIIESHVYKSIEIGGKSVPLITDAVVVMWIVMAVIMVGTLVMTRNLKTVPAGGQHLLEIFLDFINNFTKERIGHHWRHFASYLGSLLIFLSLSNMVALVNIIPSGETLSKIFGNPALEHFNLSLHAPAKNFNVTLCFAIMSIVVVLASELRFKGFKGWLKSFFTPTPISLVLKILDYLVRPMSLCFRMFGNILGATIVMTLVYQAAPLFMPAIVGIYFELFDGILQAYVFVFLTSMYIAEAVEEQE